VACPASSGRLLCGSSHPEWRSPDKIRLSNSETLLVPGTHGGSTVVVRPCSVGDWRRPGPVDEATGPAVCVGVLPREAPSHVQPWLRRLKKGVPGTMNSLSSRNTRDAGGN